MNKIEWKDNLIIAAVQCLVVGIIMSSWVALVVIPINIAFFAIVDLMMQKNRG